ncbi:MAG: D-alanyl-D-alanine carboxypeptidase/D-alanyl-D-alanine-endopeptidase [Gemmatimonadaceae bacterium]|nr:D-alanyl-D-alanine carboxypeptidase/D-alanyl-D-alanine-endopeptidase [Gemmatimonadaceae bacterium]
MIHSIRRQLLAGALLSLLSPLGGNDVISVGGGPEASAQTRTTSGRTRAAARQAPAENRSPSWTTTRSATDLTAALGRTLDGSVRSGSWGVMVVSITRGDTLFGRNAAVMMQPASTMKMYTAAVAFDRLGADHTFKTSVTHDGTVNGELLEGNLFLRGEGDPSLSPRYFPDERPMDRLARQVAARGIRRVTGNVVADASAFEDRLVPEGWQQRYLGAAYAARVSALSLNNNLVWVVVQPVGGQASVTLEPASTTTPVVSNVRMVAGSGGRITAVRQSDGSIRVNGSVGRSAPAQRYSLVVDDPPRFTGGALKAALQGAGVAVGGDVVLGTAPRDADALATVESPPLWQIVNAMNRESINIFAELLFRNAGRGQGQDQEGSAATALASLRDFMAEKAGTNPEEVFAADGSGLSVLNMLTARSMVQLLAYSHRAPWGPSFHASLPVAGVSETLRTRMRGAPAAGNLHAKTGTTNTVVSLGGYVTAKNGEVLAFAFMYNGADRWNARATMDAMGSTLAEFSR